MVKKKKDLIWVPPRRCPLMKTCEEDVDWETFSTICNSKEWIFCEAAPPAVTKKYKRKPCEWKLVEELGGFPKVDM